MHRVRISRDSPSGLQTDRMPEASPASSHPLYLSIPHDLSPVTVDLERSNSIGYLSHRKNLSGHFIPFCLVRFPLSVPLGKWTAGFCVNHDGHSSSIAVLESSKCPTESRSCCSQTSIEEGRKQTQVHVLVHAIGQPAEFQSMVKGASVSLPTKINKYNDIDSFDHS